MARLIDADELIRDEEVQRKGCAYIEEINRAPTVEAQEYLDRIKELETTVQELREINEEYACGENEDMLKMENERQWRTIIELKAELGITRRVAVESIVAMAREVADD